MRGLREIVGQGSGAGAESVVRVRHSRSNLQDSDLQHIAVFGLLDEDRAGEEMSAGSFVFHFRINSPEFRFESALDRDRPEPTGQDCR